MGSLQLQRGGEGGQGGEGKGGEVGEEGVGGGGGDEGGVVAGILVRGEPGGGRGEVGERGCGWVRLVQGVGGEEGEGGGRGVGGQPAVELLVEQLLDRRHGVAQVRLQDLPQHRLGNEI